MYVCLIVEFEAYCGRVKTDRLGEDDTFYSIQNQSLMWAQGSPLLYRLSWYDEAFAAIDKRLLGQTCGGTAWPPGRASAVNNFDNSAPSGDGALKRSRHLAEQEGSSSYASRSVSVELTCWVCWCLQTFR
jgi:hypothetical protein